MKSTLLNGKTFFFGILTAAALLFGCKGSKQDSSKVLRLPMVADAKTFDPALVSDYYSAIVTSMVYEGLVEYDYHKRPHELRPLLAESMPEISRDGLTYTFKIRSGVRFVDHKAFAEGKGREVTAKDFVYSLLRIADPKLTSESFWTLDGHVVGLNEWRDEQGKAEKTNYDVVVPGIVALDDRTLQIKLKQKYPQLMFVLAMPSGFVVAREVVEALGTAFVNQPVGTGPYKLVDWQRNSRLTFERNPNFRGQAFVNESGVEEPTKIMPFVDRVEYHVFVEESTGWLSFKSSRLEYNAIPKDNFAEAVNPATKELVESYVNAGITLYKNPEADITYTAFNMEDPIIKKGGANLRKAIALAVDKNKSIELFRNGRAVLAHSPIPPTLAGYDERFKNPYAEFNLELAKQYLAQAGFPEGKGLPELVYETSQGTTSRQMAEKLQTELAAIGIKLKISANQFRELTQKINDKKAQMWGIAWLADYPDAENFLQLLYGKNQSPGPNGSNFDNAEYNKLYEQVRGMADSPERRKLIGQMNAVFVKELPWVLESHRIGYTLTMPWLKNFKEGYMGSSIAKFLDIDEERKAQGIKGIK